MKHTYNNWSSNLFDGFYNSNLEPNYYLLQDMAENDIAEGIIKEGQTYDITGDNYIQYEKDEIFVAQYFVAEHHRNIFRLFFRKGKLSEFHPCRIVDGDKGECYSVGQQVQYIEQPVGGRSVDAGRTECARCVESQV